MIGTVLIVDDEALVRKTLIKMIESNDTGWTVIGEAENGCEAWEAIRNGEPDLILTDIRMPLMDGLELAKLVHTHRLESEVIVLTGYKDFEYAQAALQYGVLDFLLKPRSEHEVCEVLAKTHRLMVDRKQKRDLDRRLEEEAAVRALFYRMPIGAAAAGRLQDKFAAADAFIVQVEAYDPNNRGFGREDLDLLQFAVGNVLQESLRERDADGLVVQLHYELFVLLGRIETTVGGLEKRMWADGLRQTVFRLLNLSVRMVDAEGLQGLPRMTDLLRETGKTAVRPVDETRGELPLRKDRAVYAAKIQNLQDRFLSYLMTGHLDRLHGAVRHTAAPINSADAQEAKMEALSIVVALHQALQSQFPAASLQWDFTAEMETLHRLEEAAEVQDWLSRWTDALMADAAVLSENKDRTSIHRAMEYIEKYYNKRCSLLDVASHLHLNYNYFSLLFKRETGETFVSYLTRIRLEKAGRLLCQTDLKVTEVALAVGYDDPNYFTSVFRRKYLLTPGEYRKTHKK